jgi:spore germination cell wall hydrolase CwlJ-like protein
MDNGFVLSARAFVLALCTAGCFSPAAAEAPIRLLIGAAEPEPRAAAAVIHIGGPGASVPGDAPTSMDSDDPLNCMAQAVYYEARSESVEGQEAVAQVVINRTRLSPWADSICGVVFQRARETSGCQFSFVCDGAMDRATDWAAWDRARMIARQALAGFVYKPLATATHYHAARMTPYWSSHLARLRRIGGHVFYR